MYVCMYIYIYIYIYICVSAVRLIASRFRRRGGRSSRSTAIALSIVRPGQEMKFLFICVAGARSLARPEPGRLRGRSLSS